MTSHLQTGWSPVDFRGNYTDFIHSGVNFINILQAAFKRADPNSAKRY